jgi:serine/threonine protein kinase/formylglycine-generating enzyme required for sulfatase activity
MSVLAIGDFDVFTDKVLGSGGWGKVYLGRQRSLNRQVAVKFLNADMTREADFVARFRREAQCLASIADDHIIQVYGAGEHEGSQWFAMEFVEGATLQKFIDRGRKFDEGEALIIGMAVARALKAAWSSPEKIVHRDIKPSNVLVASGASPNLTAYGETRKHGSSVLYTNFRGVKIKVMDFGLAKLKKEDNEKTLPGTVMGTPKYISPEQAQGKAADIRSDIYSLGVMIFQLACGRAPFEGDTAISMITKHIYDEPPVPSSILPSLSREIDSIILKCLGKEPADRYQTPEALIEDINAWLNGKRPRISMGEQTKVMPQQGAKSVQQAGVTVVKRKSGGGKAAVFVLLLLCGGVAALGFLPPDGKKRGFVGNLEAHRDWVLRKVNPPPKTDPDTGKTEDPLLPTESPEEKARRLARIDLGEANIALKVKNLEEARRLFEKALGAAPELPELKEFDAMLREAETKDRQEKSRVAAKGDYDRLISEATTLLSGGKVAEAIVPLEKAVGIAREHGLPELGDAEARLSDAKTKKEAAERFDALMREAGAESDAVKALAKLEEALRIAPPERVTEISGMCSRLRGEAADKVAADAAKLEGEKDLKGAEALYEKALGLLAGHAASTAGLERLRKLMPAGAAWIPAGKFLYGPDKAEKELPAFWIEKKEVTAGEYHAFLDEMKKQGKEIAPPKHWKDGKPPDPSLPVRGARVEDAQKFAEWRGPGWRLPTELEWERAARGTEGRVYPWGDAWEDGKAHVASKMAGPVAPGGTAGDVTADGCLDMSGNVAEWTSTMYDPEKALYANLRAVRGGSWLTTTTEATSFARRAGPKDSAEDIGIRLVWTPP